jgi:3',5'-cyclic AMP phosphodiesterase CpdA
MKLLHISDLHVTYRDETLETLWLGPAAALRQRRQDQNGDDKEFDFVVVSGDLSQAAANHEYAAVERLIRNKLLPLLKVPDMWRIIMVPGNHDVDWDLEFPEWDAARCSASGEIIDQEWRDLVRAPELSRLRVEIRRDSARFFDIGVKQEPGVAQHYFERFRNVQHFLDSIYGTPPAGSKPFNLLSDGDDWSLHLFEEEKVAFFGLNSCSRNDKCWTGASFGRSALGQVEGEAVKLRERWGRDALLIAVWHHGLEADKGRPDRLRLADIAALHNAGIRVAFHGHLHQDVSGVVRLLDRAMVLVSTGSIGAHAKDRPDCVRNQFGIVDLNPACVSIQRYEREPNGIYVGGASELFHVTESAPSPAPHATSFVERQSRTWKVSEDGIARIGVTFERVRNPAGLVLAVAGAPYANIIGDDCATVDGERVDVQKKDAENGIVSFRLPDEVKSKCDNIEWSLAMSNVVSFSQADLMDFGLSPRARRPTRFPNCPDGYDQISTKVLVPSAELELTLELDERVGTIAAASVIVEQEHEANDATRWTVEQNASRRCSLLTDGDRIVRLVCKYPVVGQRYSILYRADASRQRLPAKAASLSCRLLEIALRSPPRPDAYDVVGGMTQGVRKAIWTYVSDRRAGASIAVDAFLGGGTDWIGLLWDRDRKRLYPAFGEFIRHDWSVSFAAGETARGHAFRFGRASGWHPQAPQSRILAPTERCARRERDRTFKNSWNLSIPIRIHPLGPAMGVVSLHGGMPVEPERFVERELELLAEHCTDRSPTIEQSDGLAELVRAVNFGFWDSLTELTPFLGKSEIEFAREIAALFAPARPRLLAVAH